MLDTSNGHSRWRAWIRRWGRSWRRISTRRRRWWPMRRIAGRKTPGPTINMDISKLGTVIRHKNHSTASIGDPVGDARPALHHYQLIGGGGKQERRPTGDELAAIFKWMREHPGGRRRSRICACVNLCAFRRGEGASCAGMMSTRSGRR